MSRDVTGGVGGGGQLFMKRHRIIDIAPPMTFNRNGGEREKC